ncbi:hypothetical protein FX985_02120 [Pseudomonas extremaustralis]|uniref:Uncharacterized protein n=1 Tax=Pseudomonas extremaustralis TaxID=359110 RepID=A0A5M9IZ28_9PSED|nr:hypothetical protein FX985_02120 [Pseudomonas extremaustralis]
MHFFVTHVVVPYTPQHSAPRLGSVCPHSGFGAWAAAMGHPWPRTANPASCRVTHAPKPAFGQRGLTGRRRSKAKARRPYSRPVLCLVYSVKCGRGLAPDEGVSVTYLLTDPALSGASPLPHLDLHRSDISISQVDLILLLLCFCSAFALLLLCFCSAFALLLLCFCSAFALLLLCFCSAFALLLLCFCSAFALLLLCFCSAFALLLLCFCSGF